MITPQLSKKDKVRNYLLDQHEGYKFSVLDLSTATNTDTKAVSNVINDLRKEHVVDRVRDSREKCFIYTLDKNRFALHMGRPKNGNGVELPPHMPTVEKALEEAQEPPAKTSGPKTRRKVRPPFIMAIDTEIAELEAKVKRLRQVRRDFI